MVSGEQGNWGMDFTGQVAIVSGAAGGIGRAAVAMLRTRNARVIASDLPEALADFNQQAGPELQLQPADIRDPKQVDALCQATLDRWGQVDMLIACAGTLSYTAFEDINAQQWADSLSTNLHGAYHLARAVLRPMMRRRYGRIVYVAGLHGVAGGPFQADYSAATGGVLGLMRALAREAAPWSITVNAITAGMIDTPMLKVFPEQQIRWGEQVIALHRVGKPEEVAAAALFLASPLASYITGVTLPVDGGWRMA